MSQGTAKDIGAVVSAAGEIVGRTRLQKTISLLEMVGLGYGFRFEYYKFGPYSEELAISVDRAVDLGYVTEEEKRAAWGGRYSIFHVTGDRKLTGIPARDNLIDIAKNADAIALELAVTAAFLARTGAADAWNEVAMRKPEKVGGNHLANAKSLYQRLAQVAGLPTPLPAIT